MSSLIAEPLQGPEMLEQLRLIRNAAAWGFSHDNEPISPQAQRAWWIVNQDYVHVWLYREQSSGITVGFGMLRPTPDGRWWASVGVLPEHTRQGFGSAIMAELIRRHDGPVYSTARADNPGAVGIHRFVDWAHLLRCDPALSNDRSLVGFVTLPHVYKQTEAFVD